MSDRQHGGPRPGAGRPKNTGRYREPTQPRRLPLSLIPTVDQLLQNYQTPLNNGPSLPNGRDNTDPVTSLGVASLPTRVSPDTGAPPAADTYLTVDDPWPDEGILRVTEHYPIEPYSTISLPLYGSKVAAGFPSPAADYVEGRIDLNALLVKHHAATFLVRVQGDSMIGAGIHPNDILIVDRSLTPTDGRIVIAVISGELTVKRLKKKSTYVTLLPENPAYQPIVVNDNSDFMIWGVVTNVIHPL